MNKQEMDPFGFKINIRSREFKAHSLGFNISQDILVTMEFLGISEEEMSNELGLPVGAFISLMEDPEYITIKQMSYMLTRLSCKLERSTSDNGLRYLTQEDE